MRCRRRLGLVLLVCVAAGSVEAAHEIRVAHQAASARDAARRDSRRSLASVRPVTASGTNAEVIESAVLEIRQLADPATRAALLAQAAAACQRWDRRRASELARETAAELAVIDTAAAAMAPQLRLSAIRTLTEVNPKLAVSAAERTLKDPQDVESVRVQAAVATRGSDPEWAKQQFALVRDPARRALAALRVSMASVHSGVPPRAVAWSDVEAALPVVRQTRDPWERARMLTALGALAKRGGRGEEWESEYLPEVRRAVASITDAFDRAAAYSDCLEVALALDQTIAPELLASAEHDIRSGSESRERRDELRAWVMRVGSPAEALRLAKMVGVPKMQAALLIGILLQVSQDDAETLRAGSDMALSLLQRGNGSLGSYSGLLYVAAKSQPDSALAVARRKGKALGQEQRFCLRVLAGAASTQPEWALSHVRVLRDPEARAQVMLASMQSRAESGDCQINRGGRQARQTGDQGRRGLASD